MSEYCCKTFEHHATTGCGDHASRRECPDTILDECDLGWGIPVHDGGSSVILISYCPWCGKKVSNAIAALDDAARVEP